MAKTEIDASRARALIKRSRTDLAFHIEHVQGVTTLEPFQRRVINAVSRALQGKGRKRIAISACHDVGKTFTIARIALALGSCFKGAKIITTAPSFQLVEKLLWGEIRAGFAKSKYPLGGRMLNTEWKIGPEWFAIGMSPKEDAGGGEGQGTSSGFQGFHGDLVVILFDEATGVPPKRWIQAEGMMTSANVVFIAIGNPTSRSSPFFKCFSSSAWETIYLSCFDSPNLIAAGITDMDSLTAEYDLLRGMSEDDQAARIASYPVVQPRLLTAQWVLEKALEWGLDHVLFISKVLGRFPDDDDHVLMSLGAVEAAQRRDYEPKDSDRYAIGVDVARYGSDKSVIKIMHGPKVIASRTLVKQATTAVAGEVISMLRALDSQRVTIAIDGTGVGAGVVDALHEALRSESQFRGVEIREVNFGSGFSHESEEEQEESKKLYVNRKAKLFVRLASDLKQNIALPQDSVYPEELPTILFRFDSKGRYVIESKDEYKKRTGRSSPDDADSLALANEARYTQEGVGSFTALENVSSDEGTLAPDLQSGDQW